MDSLPIWAIWSTIPGVVVLAPVLAFLLATATVIIIGLLKEVAVPAVLAFTAAGISGWLLARKARARSRSLSVVTAVESGSLGGMTRAAVGNVTPFPASASRRRAARHCQLKRPWYAGRVGGAAARVGELLCSPIMLPRSSRAAPEKALA